jgi:6-phosphogluconolactonase
MTPDILIYADHDQVMQAAAEELARTARDAVAHDGSASIALSGGSTPRGLHRLLGQSPFAGEMPWERMHLFWADERLVPYDHPDSNFGAARKDFIDTLCRRPAGIHPIPVTGKPHEMAQRYEQELRGHFRSAAGAAPSFDLIFLGLGTDGHTASLLPGSTALREQQRWAVAVKGGQPDLWRVSLTVAVLNRARRVVFLVTGEAKAAIVQQALNGSSSPDLPVQQLRPPAGRLVWLLDRTAAANLPPDAGRRTNGKVAHA